MLLAQAVQQGLFSSRRHKPAPDLARWSNTAGLLHRRQKGSTQPFRENRETVVDLVDQG
jgi:hypothetical protein